VVGDRCRTVVVDGAVHIFGTRLDLDEGLEIWWRGRRCASTDGQLA
jgi:hypothetical protein